MSEPGYFELESIYEQYLADTRDVECAMCHITPRDYLDEAMMYGGWQEAFFFDKRRKKWYCLGCHIGGNW